MGATFIATALSLVLWAASFIYFRLYLSRRTGARNVLAEMRDEVDKLVSEIDSATDRDVTLVEDRMKSLRALLDETDKRLGTMRREAERRGSEEKAYAEIGRRGRTQAGRQDYGDYPPAEATAMTVPAGPASMGATLPQGSPQVAQVSELPDTEPNPAGPVPTASPAPQSAFQPAPQPTPAGTYEPGRPRFSVSAKPVEPKPAPFSERVLELHRAGFSEDLIAKRLGTTIGEVDLAIALSGRMDSAHVDDTGN